MIKTAIAMTTIEPKNAVLIIGSIPDSWFSVTLLRVGWASSVGRVVNCGELLDVGASSIDVTAGRPLALVILVIVGLVLVVNEFGILVVLKTSIVVSWEAIVAMVEKLVMETPITVSVSDNTGSDVVGCVSNSNVVA
jgi:hypothetical protein